MSGMNFYFVHVRFLDSEVFLSAVGRAVWKTGSGGDSSSSSSKDAIIIQDKRRR